MFQWVSNMYVIECKQGWAHEYFLCYGWIFFNLPHPYIIYPWFTGMVTDWWSMTQVSIYDSRVNWCWLTTQGLINDSSVDWQLKCQLMTQMLIDDTDLWPKKTGSMAK